MTLQSGNTLGPYCVLELLGEGGMARVYRAVQPSLEREVAVKVIGQKLAGQLSFQARFRREAAVLARLEHPNVLAVYDYGEQEGVAYIVYRYVSGGTLKRLMGLPRSPSSAGA